ncbi:MAG: class II aldolase/adducin family protein [Planctomycetaceae bacterium]|jgi:L-fuculose-phosphate aldolase|nr:class II aldolase/adducin family protein [Planctomycetaceae bacterium]
MINLHQVKEEICDIGRRIYNKGFVAANDGNISVRIDENRLVCTPTGVSKGFMKPDDLCVVDMNARQISGRLKMTSEVRQHITIMKHRSDVKSVVHCHPPHATAFGIAREAIPQCLMPEVEVHIGDVPIAKYTIPGGQEFADAILPFVDKSDIIVQANHGTVSYGPTLERAYFLVEMLDAYCRILLIARSLGKIEYFTKDEAQGLLDLKSKWGMKDPRTELTNCELCANDIFRDSWKETGVGNRAFQPPVFNSAGKTAFSSPKCAECRCSGGVCKCTESDPDQELLVKAITDRVMQALSKAG